MVSKSNIWYLQETTFSLDEKTITIGTELHFRLWPRSFFTGQIALHVVECLFGKFESGCFVIVSQI